MGQRHQIYVVRKKQDEYKALGAFHHQWCYGMRASTNLCRAVSLIEKNKVKPLWCDYTASDPREIESVIKATYGIDFDGTISMVHNEAEYLIENDRIRPERGDNNDGCSLIVIDEDKKELRAGFFTPNYLKGKHARNIKKNKAFTIQEYISFYYNSEEQKDTGFNNSFKEQLEFINGVSVKPIKQKELSTILGKIV